MKTASDIQCARDLLAGFAHTQPPVDFMLDQVANHIAAHREREVAGLRSCLLAIEKTTGNDEYKAMIRKTLGLPPGDPI